MSATKGCWTSGAGSSSEEKMTSSGSCCGGGTRGSHTDCCIQISCNAAMFSCTHTNILHHAVASNNRIQQSVWATTLLQHTWGQRQALTKVFQGTTHCCLICTIVSYLHFHIFIPICSYPLSISPPKSFKVRKMKHYGILVKQFDMLQILWLKPVSMASDWLYKAFSINRPSFSSLNVSFKQVSLPQATCQGCRVHDRPSTKLVMKGTATKAEEGKYNCSPTEFNL